MQCLLKMLHDSALHKSTTDIEILVSQPRVARHWINGNWHQSQ